VGPAKPASAVPPTNSNAASGIDQAVQQIAAEHALSADLIHSMIKVESNYNVRAVSPKGARGLMQLVPSTARRFGVSDAFNPRENIDGGVKYLRYLLDLYGGNYPLALAAYNAGEGAVARYRGVPPFHETQNYLILLWKQLEKSRKTVSPQREGEPK
jgi:soluble lytic murein transglycosylase-like protein